MGALGDAGKGASALAEVATEEARDELTDFTVYRRLAAGKNASSSTFAKLSAME